MDCGVGFDVAAILVTNMRSPAYRRSRFGLDTVMMCVQAFTVVQYFILDDQEGPCYSLTSLSLCMCVCVCVRACTPPTPTVGVKVRMHETRPVVYG